MITQLKTALGELPENPSTKEVRNLAKPYKTLLKSYPIEEVYHLCESLLDDHQWASTILAYQLIYDQHNRYNLDTFSVFDRWVKTYIRDWWDCDDFMTHAVAECLKQFPAFIPYTFKWMTADEFAVRRSAPVVLIRLAQRNFISFSIIKYVCDALLEDPHYLVQKGYGWLLKESVKHYKDELIEYVEDHHKTMPRTAFRYAIEKLDKQERSRLMAL